MVVGDMPFVVRVTGAEEGGYMLAAMGLRSMGCMRAAATGHLVGEAVGASVGSSGSKEAELAT